MAASSEVEAWMREGERRERRWAVAGTIAVVVVALVVVVLAIVLSTNLVEVSDERALGALRASGFRDVKLGGSDALACSEGESSRHFSAMNPRDQRVEGTVCCGLTGLAKGCTLRWGARPTASGRAPR